MVAQREKETLVELKDAADCCLDDNKKKMEILSVGHQRFKQKLTDMKEFHNINQAGLLSKESQIMELVEMAKIATQSNVVNAREFIFSCHIFSISVLLVLQHLFSVPF